MAYLGSLVLASSDEVGTVGRPLKVDDRLVELVDRDVVEQVTSLGVVSAHTAILMASDDVLAKGAPAGNSGLALVTDDCKLLLIGLLSVEVGVDLDNDDVGKITHSLLGNAQQLGAVFVKLDSLDGGGELPGLDKATALDFPEADGVVGRTGGDHGRGGVDVDSPDGSDVAVVGSKTLAVVGEPGADLLVLCDGEDEIAIFVEPGDGG